MTLAQTTCPLCGSERQTRVEASKVSKGLFQNRDIVRCNGCRMTFLSPMPTDEELHRHYEQGADWDHRSSASIDELPVYQYQAEARLRFIRERSTLNEPPRFLDIGAGFGVIEELVRQQWPEADITAVEPDTDARNRMAAKGFHTLIRFKPEEPATYDLIVLSHVVEHVPQPVEFLKMVRQHMGPKSRVFIEVPNEDYLFKTSTGSHVQFFNPETLKAALEHAGLRVLSVASCGPLRAEQKQRNTEVSMRQRIVQQIPFKDTLKRFQNAVFPKPAIAVPVEGKYDEYSTYGEDRVWIRCLAEPTS
jgi:SAM-dependent methyltransferase